MEVVSTADGSSHVDGVQVSDNYVVITDPETGGIKIKEWGNCCLCSCG